MQRDLSRLTGTTHDVIVVGGGIQGVWIAWDAALRGLSVALLERDDFGAATSANSLRIVHGGLRYLARGDLPRMRESIRERAALLRVAPSLVEPLPVLIPTVGAGTQSRMAMGAALRLNDLSAFDRNRGLRPDRRLPRGRLVAADECRRLFPAFPPSSGGALWYDARLSHPERLTLAIARAAAGRGAAVANYCRVERLVSDGGRVRGVVATDLEAGGELEIRGRTVVIAAGPWTPELAGRTGASAYALAVNVELGRRLAETAVGVRAPTGPGDDPIIGGHRFIFLVPQGATTLLGTWYAPAPAREALGTTVERGAAALVAEVRAACPALDIGPGDVVRCHWGRLPLKAGREPGRPDALAERPVVTGHRAVDGRRGIFSVEGVKYTTARGVAERVVDRIVAALGTRAVPCRTAVARVDEGLADLTAPLESRAREAARSEMALRLSDIVLRRSRLAAAAAPSRTEVAAAARAAAGILGWTDTRAAREIEEVMRQVESAA
jgi:glycerol-3-phosphate dehydrogenase